MNHTTQYDRSLTGIHQALMWGAAGGALVFGVLGAVGTFTNMTRAFHSTGTALGVVAAGEGVTALLALVTLLRTSLGQSTPTVVRTGLWALPLVACTVGYVTAPNGALSVVQAFTPLGMCGSAEVLALVVRSFVVYSTGADPEAQRRTADTTRRVAYLRAVAAQHPKARIRSRAEKKAWKLAAQVGAGDLALGAELAEVQRERLTIAADDALSSMFTLVAAAPAPHLPPQSAAPSAAVASQVSAPVVVPAPHPAPQSAVVTPHPAAPAAGSAAPGAAGSTLADVCAVSGVTEPAPGDVLTDEQVAVVLRWLRHSTNPPMSGRQAFTAFRDKGFTASDAVLREAWRTIGSTTTAP